MSDPNKLTTDPHKQVEAKSQATVAEQSKPAAPTTPAPAAPPPAAPPTPAIMLPKAPDGQMTLRVNGKDHFIDPKKYKTLIGALLFTGHPKEHSV